MRLRSGLLIGLMATASCAPKQITIQVQIQTTSCEAKTNPFEGVQFLRVRVTGDGMADPLDSVAPTGGSTREITIPEIPPGKNRVVDVRGYDGDPAMGGKVLSAGKSLPFTLPDVIPDPADNKPIPVAVFLRKVNAFSRPSTQASPGACQSMRLARAGHTATLLKDGRVYIAGGYNLMQGSTAKVSLSETEVFNPVTSAFEASPRMTVNPTGAIWIPKAFHTATLMQSGQVLLWGGETYTGGVNNYPAPAAIILVYDPEYSQYGAVPNRASPSPIPRTGHKAAIDKTGKVMIVGGQTRSASPPAELVPIDQIEYFDPETNLYKVVDSVTMPRMQTTAIAVRGGDFIAVAGGTDGTNLVNEVAYFKWAGNTFKREMPPSPPQLASPGRRAAAVATIRGDADLLVLGGYTDAKIPLYPAVTAQPPIASSEIVNIGSSGVSPGPSVGSSGPNGRGDICAVQMADGKVLAIGGYTLDGTDGRSDASTVIISSNAAGGASGIGGPALPVPRFQHTCTALADGTVLVLGGVNDQGGTREILNDAWIYQPAPTTP